MTSELPVAKCVENPGHIRRDIRGKYGELRGKYGGTYGDTYGETYGGTYGEHTGKIRGNTGKIRG